MSNKMVTIENSVRILFTGDILLHSNYNKIALEKGPDFVFERISNVFKKADLRFGNIETILSMKGAPVRGKGCITGDERYIDAIKNAGFDVLSLANNHTFDYGIEAYEDMSSSLKKAGLTLSGAGRNLEESRKMQILSVKGIRLGFLSYSSRENNGRSYATDRSPGVAPLDEEYVIEDIKRYKKDVDHLMVSLHWGIEHSPYPTPHQKSLAHMIIDEGVRIVIGNHPQILQGVERYKEGFIMYSLGNLCHSDYYWEGPQRMYQFKIRPADRESIMVKVRLTSIGIEDIDIIPLWINDGGQPEVCKGEKASAILNKLKERSEMIKRPDFARFWNNMIVKKRVESPFKIWWEHGSILDKIRNFRPSQIKTLIELAAMFLEVRFSRSGSKWHLLNPRNDKKPRPFCGSDE